MEDMRQRLLAKQPCLREVNCTEQKATKSNLTDTDHKIVHSCLKQMFLTKANLKTRTARFKPCGQRLHDACPLSGCAEPAALRDSINAPNEARGTNHPAQ